ncbi:54S ribosomal protein L22, mitochondrial, partial [Physocladia obscura]
LFAAALAEAQQEREGAGKEAGTEGAGAKGTKSATGPKGLRALEARAPAWMAAAAKGQAGSGSLDVAGEVGRRGRKGLAGLTAVAQFTLTSRAFRVSPKKTNLVAKVLRRLELHDADRQLRFSPKRVASLMRPLVQQALRHAAELDAKLARPDAASPDTPRAARAAPSPLPTVHWRVAQCFVSKAKFLRRLKLHARGRFGVMHHPASRVCLIVERSTSTASFNTIDATNPARPSFAVRADPAFKKLQELEKLAHIFKTHNLYAPFVEPKKNPVRFLNPVWSPKSYKYVTRSNWLSPKRTSR